MSKIKLSFSFLLTLVLVGMFSVVAFAAGDAPKNLKFTSSVEGAPTPVDDTVTITWDAVVGVDSYNIYFDADAVVNKTTTTFSKVIADPQKVYNVKVYSVTGGVESTEYSSLKVLFHNGTIVHPDATHPDNNISNAHKTGEGDLIKNPANQIFNNKTEGTHKLHGSYQNNTNSCASCHQTHTAASGGLLFKNGAYNTCTACHDGTLGFYNVFGTENKDDMGAGTFGGTHDGNMSAHMSTGALEISAAPGSNSKVTGANWTGEFTCASCHDPHGSYSDRLLAVNPNGMAGVTRTVVKDAQGVSNGTVYGNKLMDISVYTTLPISGISATNLNDYAFKDYTILATDIDDANDYYYNTGLKAGDRVLQLQRYFSSTTGWINAPGVYLAKTGVSNTAYWPKAYKDSTRVFPTAPTAGGTSGGTQVQKDADKADAVAGTFWFNNSKSFYKVPGTTGDGTINKISEIQKAYVVQLGYVADNKNKLGNVIPAAANGYQPVATDNNYLTTAGKGIQMNEWCGACHTDYFTRTKTNTGVDGNYNHHTMSDNYNCERCHYAHGTDAKIMRDAAGRTYEDLQGQGFTSDQAKDFLKDVNASSALKRFTNMAVCYGCHTSSHSEGFINNNDFNKTDSLNGFQSGSVTKGQKLIPWAQ
jgi:predicted CXXCH cytochrome family protein